MRKSSILVERKISLNQARSRVWKLSFGMHVFSNGPAGHIGILPKGPASTATDGFYLVIQGKGSHGATPHLGIDPIVIGSEIVLALQTVISRNVAPDDVAVVSVGKFQAGEVPNVIPDKAELAATIRTINEKLARLLRNG